MSTTNHLSNLNQNRSFNLSETVHKISLSDVFAERNGSYLNEYNLFIAHFNAIPNCIHEMDIDCRKAIAWILKTHEHHINDVYYNKRYFKHNGKLDYDDVFFFIYDDLIVYFDTNRWMVRLLFRKTPIATVDEIVAGLQAFKNKKKHQKPEISLLVNGVMGVETKTFEIIKPKLSLNDNYNDDFKTVHETIVHRLSRKNDKGLVLLHGKPGTGKTSYIRYLITKIKKEVIFLPPDLAAGITGPGLISILIDNPNSILVVEDAENIVIDRAHDDHSPVAALLNISDGLLADCLNVQIICSFNTDISKIDSALMRKGRLIAQYEFKELAVPKAQQLSNKLGFNTLIKEPMTLTAIYNQHETTFEQKGKQASIGFNVLAKIG